MKLSRSSATRVALSSAVFAVALFGLPSVAKSDRTAAAPAELNSAVEVKLPVEVVVTTAPEAASAFDATVWQDASIGNIDPKVFRIALDAAASAVKRGDAVDP